MSNQELTNQLCKRIFGNIGAVPNKIGTCGVCSSENLLSETLKFQYSNEIKTYNVWSGSAFPTNDSSVNILLSNIDSVEKPDLALVLIQKTVTSSTKIAIRYSWSDPNSGIFLLHAENSWIEMSMDHQLNLTAAIELLTQQGYSWLPVTDTQEAFALLKDLLSDDDEDDE